MMMYFDKLYIFFFKRVSSDITLIPAFILINFSIRSEEIMVFFGNIFSIVEKSPVLYLKAR